MLVLKNLNKLLKYIKHELQDRASQGSVSAFFPAECPKALCGSSDFQISMSSIIIVAQSP